MSIKKKIHLSLNPDLLENISDDPSYIQYSENQNWLVIGNNYTYYLFDLINLKADGEDISGFYTFNHLFNIDRVIPCNDGSVWIFSNTESQTLTKKTIDGSIQKNYKSTLPGTIWGNETYISGYDQIKEDFCRLSYYEKMTKIKAQINMRFEPVLIHKISTSILLIITTSRSYKKNCQLIHIHFWDVSSNTIIYKKNVKNYYINNEVMEFSIMPSTAFFHAIQLNNGKTQINFSQGYLLIDKLLNISFHHERITCMPWKHTSKKAANHINKYNTVKLFPFHCNNVPDIKDNSSIHLENIPLTVVQNKKGFFLITTGEIEYIGISESNNVINPEQEKLNMNMVMYILSHDIQQHYKSPLFIISLIYTLPEEFKSFDDNKDYIQLLKQYENKIVCGLNHQSSKDQYFQILVDQHEYLEMETGIEQDEFLELWKKIYFIHPYLPDLAKAIVNFIKAIQKKSTNNTQFLAIHKTALDKKNTLIFEQICGAIEEAVFNKDYTYKDHEISFILSHSKKPFFTFNQILTITKKTLLFNINSLFIEYLSKFNMVNPDNYKKLFYWAENNLADSDFIEIVKAFHYLIKIKPQIINKIETSYTIQSLYSLLINEPIAEKQSLFFSIASIVKPMSAESNLTGYLFKANSKTKLAKCFKELAKNDNFSYLIHHSQKFKNHDDQQIIIHFIKELLQNNLFKYRYMQWYLSYILFVLLNRINMIPLLFSDSDKALSDTSASLILTRIVPVNYLELFSKNLNYGFELGEYEKIITLKLLQTYPLQSLQGKEMSKKKAEKLDALLETSLRDLFMNSLK